MSIDFAALEPYRVQRQGDPVICTVSCGDCNPCPPGIILEGIPNFFVEDQKIAFTGAATDNCYRSNACSCCPRPNFITTGWFLIFLGIQTGLVRKLDNVTNGFFSAGALRTYISGVSTNS